MARGPRRLAGARGARRRTVRRGGAPMTPTGTSPPTQSGPGWRRTRSSDTDRDGILDGKEYRCCAKSDGDSTPDANDTVPDNLEDANKNGRWDAGETDATRVDRDADGVQDGEGDHVRHRHGGHVRAVGRPRVRLGVDVQAGHGHGNAHERLGPGQR